MCGPAALPLALVASAAVGAVGAGAGAIQGSKNRKAARQAQAANEASAAREAQRAEEQYNKTNQKMPDVASLFRGNKAGAMSGIGSTFLTGPAGPGKAPLGGLSLLGS